MKQHRPEFCHDDPLVRLIEFAGQKSPKKARRYLRNARRAIKHILRRIKKHRKRFPYPARFLEACNQASATESRRVQVVNARPGVLKPGILPPSGFLFNPPDPSVVQQLLMPDVPCETASAAEPAENVPVPPARDATDGDDVLILAAEPHAANESSPPVPQS